VACDKAEGEEGVRAALVALGDHVAEQMTKTRLCIERATRGERMRRMTEAE
jgi:hypothetical protein